MTEQEFWSQSLLGRSAKRLLLGKQVTLNAAYENKVGLAEVYNNAISSSTADILVFVHDDVWLEDIKIIEKIATGLCRYDVIGVAGNRRLVKNQPSWFFSKYSKENGFTEDDFKNLSGHIYHGSPGAMTLAGFGPTPRKCKLIDGVFMAANRTTLVKNGVKFDPIFEFDFYDLDFCRKLLKQDLTLGTWPIDLVHKSAGKFGTARWLENLGKYLHKWEAASGK